MSVPVSSSLTDRHRSPEPRGPGSREVATATRASAGPRVVEFAHPRAWGALLCASYTEGVEGRLASELDGMLGDVGRVARGLLARLPRGLRSRVGFEAP